LAYRGKVKNVMFGGGVLGIWFRTNILDSCFNMLRKEGHVIQFEKYPYY
jgi:hypothetical protein